MILINTFEEGQEIVDFYLLKKAEIKQSNTTPPKNYVDLILADTSGEISAKMWDASLFEKEPIPAMSLVKVQALVQSYRDKLQLKITRIRPATEQDGLTLSQYVRSAPIAAEDLVNVIKSTAAKIEDQEIRDLVHYCINKVDDKLLHYPAAKSMHHAYYAGLAYHTTRMLELGEFLVQQRPFLNADLIRAGIILHDIAKPEELNAELGIVTEYSFTGKLIGHISLAANWLVEAAISLSIDMSSEKFIILQHLILSHHNLGEWGSPVQPQVPEAVALHYIDTLDAKLQAVEDALDTMPQAEDWTIPLRILESKSIYKKKTF